MDIEALKGFLGMMQLTLDKVNEIIEESEQAPICEHPLQMRCDNSTMGHITWQCKICGFTYEQTAEASGDGKICTD